MLCQKCHKNLATIRYAEVVDGQVSDQHLCPECMTLHEKNAATGFELSGPAPTVRRPSPERVVREAVRMQRTCPACNIRLSRVLEQSRVGCPECYDVFQEHLEPILKGLHRSMLHKGKTPHLSDARARLRSDLQTKRALLRSVLRAENYEEAAQLRDDIRDLEAGIFASESGAD